MYTHTYTKCINEQYNILSNLNVLYTENTKIIFKKINANLYLCRNCPFISVGLTMIPTLTSLTPPSPNRDHW